MLLELDAIEPKIYALQMSSDDGRNSFSMAFRDELSEALAKAADIDDLRVLVLRGNQQWFSSGASSVTLEKMMSGELLPEELTWPREVLNFRAPVLALAEGHATGGGFALALACDFLYLSRTSLYGCNFMRVGLTPGNGTSAFLPELTGSRKALELLLTGDLKAGAWWETHSTASVFDLPALGEAALRTARGIVEKPRELVNDVLGASRERKLALFEAAFKREQQGHRISLQNEDARASLRRHLGEGDSHDP
ncbi:MAG: enoyl-CoA hydratase-related protein [Bdellovibrionota bacterium]